MHFCIPVSQQRPDALGGHYTVRWEPGSTGRGGGGDMAGLACSLG